MAVIDNGRHALTRYRVLERFRAHTYLRLELTTGRTHQIRVHMKYAGHCLFNDDEYGGDRILKGTTFTKYKQFIKNTVFSLLEVYSILLEIHPNLFQIIHCTTYHE